MPLDRIKQEARDKMELNASLGQTSKLALEDYVAQGLLKWFKYKFFSWVCHACMQTCMARCRSSFAPVNNICMQQYSVVGQ